MVKQIDRIINNILWANVVTSVPYGAWTIEDISFIMNLKFDHIKTKVENSIC